MWAPRWGAAGEFGAPVLLYALLVCVALSAVDMGIKLGCCGRGEREGGQEGRTRTAALAAGVRGAERH